HVLQAEDGMRDWSVTGVQTCALPILQAARKPAEMLFPVSGVLAKTPEETWRRYGPLFRLHSTARISPELLAALAQVEGAGNPAEIGRASCRESGEVSVRAR